MNNLSEYRAHVEDWTQNRKNELFLAAYLEQTTKNYGLDYIHPLANRAIVLTDYETPICDFLKMYFARKIKTSEQAGAFLSQHTRKGNILKTDLAEVCTMFLNGYPNPEGYTLIYGRSDNPKKNYLFFLKTEVINQNIFSNLS